MLTHKTPRTKGKVSLSRYFQKFKEGDAVAVVQELGVQSGISKRMQGRTGKVMAKRGAAYEVVVKDLNKPKKYFIHPVHLKKIQEAK